MNAEEPALRIPVTAEFPELTPSWVTCEPDSQTAVLAKCTPFQ
jgi:hypothetical protein